MRAALRGYPAPALYVRVQCHHRDRPRFVTVRGVTDQTSEYRTLPSAYRTPWLCESPLRVEPKLPPGWVWRRIEMLGLRRPIAVIFRSRSLTAVHARR